MNAKGAAYVSPHDMSRKDMSIMDVFYRFIQPEIRPDFSVMECGCNAGQNLEYLRTKGFAKLFAIEVNPNAIQEMRQTFPELDRVVTVFNWTFEQDFPDRPSKSVDVIFTMAAAMHIHPRSNFVFKHMARVAQKYVITVEPEVGGNMYVFPRNYRRLFEGLGCGQVKSLVINKLAYPEVHPMYYGYVFRMFKTEEKIQ